MKIYNVELDTKSQQEVADFWSSLQMEAENCKPENKSASRERLLRRTLISTRVLSGLHNHNNAKLDHGNNEGQDNQRHGFLQGQTC